MLVLTVTGLIAGELVTERRHMESQLQMQRESLAGLTRLGRLGELAATVAHEVNQPLMAAGTYARLVADTAYSGGANAGEIVEIAHEGDRADRSRGGSDPPLARAGATAEGPHSPAKGSGCEYLGCPENTMATGIEPSAI